MVLSKAVPRCPSWDRDHELGSLARDGSRSGCMYHRVPPGPRHSLSGPPEAFVCFLSWTTLSSSHWLLALPLRDYLTSVVRGRNLWNGPFICPIIGPYFNDCSSGELLPTLPLSLCSIAKMFREFIILTRQHKNKRQL